MVSVSNTFVVSGFVTQPDGITPIPGDVQVVIVNDGRNSNNGVAFSTTQTPTGLDKGKFSENFLGAFPPPAPYTAASGDTLTIIFQTKPGGMSIPAGKLISVKVEDVVLPELKIKLLEEDILRNKLEIFATLADHIRLHSDSFTIEGTVVQPDGFSHVPDGLEVVVVNTSKPGSDLATIPVINGDFSRTLLTVPGFPGFDSEDIVKLSVRNIVTGETVPIDVSGVTRTSLTRPILDTEIRDINYTLNIGKITQSFKLDAYFGGNILPPTITSAEYVERFDEGGAGIKLKWSRSFRADFLFYRVYRSISSNGPFFYINDVFAPEYLDKLDKNILHGVTYWYKVTVVLASFPLPLLAESDLSTGKACNPVVKINKIPVVDEDAWSARQLLNKRIVAGRTLTLRALVYPKDGDPNQLTIKIRYRRADDSEGFIKTTAPPINTITTFQSIAVDLPIPDDAVELIDIQLQQENNSTYIVDDLIVSLTGNTTDLDARSILAPSYNSDATQIIVKNKIPGDLILFDIKSKTPIRLESAGNQTDYSENATDDPVEWAEKDQTIVYSYFTGFDYNHNSTSHLRRMSLTLSCPPIRGAVDDIPDTEHAVFPKVAVSSCEDNPVVVFLVKDGGFRAIKKIGLRNDPTSVLIPTTADLSGAKTIDGANSIDLDIENNILIGTTTSVLENTINGGENRLLVDHLGDYVQYGNKTFIPGRLAAYIDISSIDMRSFVIKNPSAASYGTRAEYLLDTTELPDGLVKFVIRGIDRSLNPNTTNITIRNFVVNVRPTRLMFASAITDPNPVPNRATLTVPNAILGGITNKCIAMAPGNSSATRGTIQFWTTETNRLLTNLGDTFTQNPRLDFVNATTNPEPIRLVLTWITDTITAEPGGTLNPCILTVNTGGAARNIFLPDIPDTSKLGFPPAQMNPLTLFVSEDGSTYYDNSLMDLARKASNKLLINIAPELSPLPRFTNASMIPVKWCHKPGSPRDQIISYILLRSTEPNANFTPIFSTINNETLSYVDPDIVDGTTYFYKIQAVDILGNSITSTQTAFTIADRHGALEKLGFIQVDLNIDDIKVNDKEALEPGTGKIFSPRTTFSLSKLRNKHSPKITTDSKVYADITYQRMKDVRLNIPPVTQVNSVVGEISGAFVQDVDYVFIKDDNIQSGSVKARELVRFIKQERRVVEEEVTRGKGSHTADGLSKLFATEIESVSMPVRVTEPATVVAGFIFKLTSQYVGKDVDGKKQVILEVHEVTNTTRGYSYQINDIVPNYIQSPALVQLDIFTNMGRFPFPEPTDKITITYSYLRIFPKNSYELDRAHNAIRWLNGGI